MGGQLAWGALVVREHGGVGAVLKRGRRLSKKMPPRKRASGHVVMNRCKLDAGGMSRDGAGLAGVVGGGGGGGAGDALSESG